MSALTKIFVVLLVILSVMLTAGLVVFVNKVEDFKKLADTKDQASKREMTARVSAEQDAQNARTALTVAGNDFQARALLLTQAVTDARDSERRAQADKAAAQAAADKAGVDMAGAQRGQTAALEALKTTELALNETRKQADEQQKKNAELSGLISAKINENDVLKRRYDKAEETNVALTDQIEQMRQMGARAAGAGAGGGVAAPAPAPPGGGGGAAGAAVPNGVIRSTRSINGVNVATISIGSADNVRQGMNFKVVDKDKQQFLGYLRIISVDYNEAVGSLTGPQVNSIRQGNEVAPSWQ